MMDCALETQRTAAAAAAAMHTRSGLTAQQKIIHGRQCYDDDYLLHTSHELSSDLYRLWKHGKASSSTLKSTIQTGSL